MNVLKTPLIILYSWDDRSVYNMKYTYIWCQNILWSVVLEFGIIAFKNLVGLFRKILDKLDTCLEF